MKPSERCVNLGIWHANLVCRLAGWLNHVMSRTSGKIELFVAVPRDWLARVNKPQDEKELENANGTGALS